MSDFMSMFFGPLDKKACLYFLFLSVVFFIILVLTACSELLYVVRNYKNLNLRLFTNGILILFNFFIVYFVNRLMYTMCSKSLI
jgi:hypothetical protein